MHWEKAKAGDVLMAVEKAMGIPKGGKVKRLSLIKLVDVRREQLGRIMQDKAYGLEELKREGFPLMSRSDFIEFFCNANGCNPWDEVTRLEFVRVTE
jgi:hypothetical protein